MNRARWLASTAHRGRRVFILFTPRSGSKVLVSHLRSLAGVDCQYEILNPNYTRKRYWLARVAGESAGRFDNPSDVHAFISAHLTAADGAIAGAKILLEQAERSGAGIESLCEHFRDEYFIVLYRENLLEQFVSLKAAQNTGEWGHFTRDGAVQRDRVRIQFDRSEFDAFAAIAKSAYERQVDALTRLEIDFLPISYESLCAADPFDLRSRLATFLNTELGADELTFDTTKQARGELADCVTNPEALPEATLAEGCLLELPGMVRS